MNLLLLEDADSPSKQHYVWIKNMPALVCHRTKHRKTTRVKFLSPPLYVPANARRSHTVLFSARASTGRLSKSPKRKGVRTKVPIEHKLAIIDISNLLVDASDHTVSGALAQTGEDGKEHPIAFTSQKLNKTQKLVHCGERGLCCFICTEKIL